MNFQTICDIIFKLYLYADAFKMIHYCTELTSGFAHGKCDEIRVLITIFADDLAEQYFGYAGRPDFDQLSLKQDINTSDDPGKLCGSVQKLVDPVWDYVSKKPELSNLVSLIDDFKGKLNKYAFLFTFDKVSNFKMEKK